MEIKVQQGTVDSISVDALIITVFEGMEEPEGALATVDRALEGTVTALIKSSEIKGKKGELTLIHTMGKLPAARVLVAGMGKQKDAVADTLRYMVGEACRFLQKKGIKEAGVATYDTGIGSVSDEELAQAIAEGAGLGCYEFREYMTDDKDHSVLEKLTLVTNDEKVIPVLEDGVNKGTVITEAVALARDMVNQPGNAMTPSDIAEIAEQVAGKNGLDITILEKEQMKELGMGGLLGVNQGSVEPPKLIVLNYWGRKSDDVDITLVGKGITFDSGGISIKPSQNMEEMKGDMSGAASVIAAIGAIAQLGLEINVRTVVPATENMPSGSAIKPGDVVRIMNGKTVEVISTDAEGRMILSDALCYTNKLGTKYVVDVATLTGACVVALGEICTGAFGNNQDMILKMLSAAAVTGEYMWQMPMFEEYKEMNKSTIATIKNVGNRYAGAITAAQFLSEFVDEMPWVHLDIAGPFMTRKDKGYQVKGATGVPVRTLVKFVEMLT